MFYSICLGTVPSEFRGEARKQISRYDTATFHNGTVAAIVPASGTPNSNFQVLDGQGKQYTARKIVLGTGLIDILPDTPGVQDAWARGMYWCPWCDGYEHRDQPIGIVGSLSRSFSTIYEIANINKDIVLLVNGTQTPDQEEQLSKQYPTWEKQLKDFNAKIENRTIASIERLQDGGKVNDPKKGLEFDKFRVHFTEGAPLERGTFITNFDTAQRSSLPKDLGLEFEGAKVKTNNVRSSLPGIWVIGDANSNGVTNVPHAMTNGRTAAVQIHGGFFFFFFRKYTKY